MADAVEYTKEGHVAILSINRPDRLNAINGEVLTSLVDYVKQIKKDDDIRCFILTGGPRSDGRPCFSAGDDLKEASQGNFPTGNPGFKLTNNIDDMWKPSIAAVDGVCTTGAIELALACDMRVVGEQAQISDWHLKRLGSGLGGWGASTRLPRVVGLANAKDMILTGKVLTGEEALRMGFAQRLFPSDKLMEGALEMAHAIAEMRPKGVRLTMAHLARTLELSKDEALNFAKEIREWFEPARTFVDAAKGVIKDGVLEKDKK